MPLFYFINTSTMETFDKFMLWEEKEAFLNKNSEVQDFYLWKSENDPAQNMPYKPFSHDVRHEFTKKGPDERFKQKLGAISKAHPGNKMNTW